ncbi:whey acidic protein-like [Gigantopelta aegis]|uniref:whey acidic protein-like n=1 Tax=Gigantopelta aegis TaxID=1735272 RepID=UPI001B88884F|nr:whey acidic protein-like [Gigantopelta aegis]
MENMHVKILMLLTVFVVIQINNLSHADPCSTVDCQPGKTCRLQAVTCVRAPCPPVAICDESIVDSEKCGPGSGPVLDSNGKAIFCGRGPNRRTCPDHTTCKIDPLDRFAVCCWQDKTKPVTKPGSCPKPKSGFGICIARCSNDGDCPGPLKCCGSCPRECTKPEVKPKPGSCPRHPWFFSCGNTVPCTADSQCKGKLKCCTTRCGRICTKPVNHKWWWWLY